MRTVSRPPPYGLVRFNQTPVEVTGTDPRREPPLQAPSGPLRSFFTTLRLAGLPLLAFVTTTLVGGVDRQSAEP